MVSCLVLLIVFAKEGISEVVIFFSGKNDVTGSSCCQFCFVLFSCITFFIDALTNHHKCDHLTVLKVRLPCLFQLLGGGACTS